MAGSPPVIAVDGPGGAGKGTLCFALAEKLGWHLLDSGAIYRVLAVAALHAKLAPTAEGELAKIAEQLDVSFVMGAHVAKVVLAGEEVTDQIRSEEIGSLTSQIAVWPQVRKVLLKKQRAFRQLPGLVADGRDMGTVVFPDAKIKIFLDASAEERAKRRIQQLQEKGFNANFAHLLNEIQQRDQRDRTRPVAPLKPAKDALVIDSSQMSRDEVLNYVLDYVKKHVKQ